MLYNMQQAVAGTYFEKWLRQGQFQWPDESTIKASAQDDEEKAAEGYVPVSPTDSNTSSGADAVLDPDPAVPPHPASESAAEDETGTGDSSKGGAEDAMSGVEHGGRPRSDSTTESVTGWEVNQANKAIDDDTKTVSDRVSGVQGPLRTRARSGARSVCVRLTPLDSYCNVLCFRRACPNATSRSYLCKSACLGRRPPAPPRPRRPPRRHRPTGATSVRSLTSARRKSRRPLSTLRHSPRPWQQRRGPRQQKVNCCRRSSRTSGR